MDQSNGYRTFLAVDKTGSIKIILTKADGAGAIVTGKNLTLPLGNATEVSALIDDACTLVKERLLEFLSKSKRLDKLVFAVGCNSLTSEALTTENVNKESYSPEQIANAIKYLRFFGGKKAPRGFNMMDAILGSGFAQEGESDFLNDDLDLGAGYIHDQSDNIEAFGIPGGDKGEPIDLGPNAHHDSSKNVEQGGVSGNQSPEYRNKNKHFYDDKKKNQGDHTKQL